MKKYLIALMLISTLSTGILIRNFRQRTVNSQASEVSIPTATATPAPVIPTLTQTTIVSSRRIYIGMWTQGFWDDSSKTLNTGHLTNLESKLDKKFAIAHYYRGWDALQSENLLNELNIISSQGWRPMLSANPYFFSGCQWTEKGLYRTIADGNCDEFLKRAAINLKRFPKPFFFRFAWEMNLPANEWGMKNTNSSPESYVSAWKHIHDLFKGEGLTNILWVWSPNSITPDSVPYSQLYPGDEYVDWTGIDVYNWGNTQAWSSWQGFYGLFKQSYDQMLITAPNKPLMIAEINTTDQGGNKPAWYTDLLNTQLPANFPAVDAIVFYNEDRTNKERVNWLIDISPESLTSFKSGIQKDFYSFTF